MVARLPPEIIGMILEYALPPLDAYFTRTREHSLDRSLAAFAAAAGRDWLALARCLLWHAVHVGSIARADKLIRALELELPQTPDSKGYLVPLVHRLELDLRERPVLDVRGPTKRPRVERAHLDGVLPVHVTQLATLLPHLESLSISVSVPGGWLAEAAMLEALRRIVERDVFRHLDLTSSGLGFENALAVFRDSPRLESLRLRGIVPSWTLLAGTTPPTQPRSPLPFPFARSLVQLVLWECRLDPQEFVELFTSLSLSASSGQSQSEGRSTLRHVVLHRLESRDPTGTRCTIPFPPATLVSSLAPLVPHLATFHLVLASPPSSSSSTAQVSTEFPLDALARHFSETMRVVVLGGPSLLSVPILFETWAQGAFRPRSITFTQCAFSTTTRGRNGGLSARDLVGVLGGRDGAGRAAAGWTRELELIDVEGMTDGEDGQGWDARSLDELRATVDGENERRRERPHAGRELRLKYDEGVERREREEREWNERRTNRNRRGARR
ncbi:hypothetical protein JCM11491_001523 [Sporobolomyces phaffii]